MYMYARTHSPQFTTYDGYALVALVLAIVVYYAEKERTERDESGDAHLKRETVDSPYLGGNIAAQPARMSFNDVPGRTLMETRSRSGSALLFPGLENGNYGNMGASARRQPSYGRSRSHEPRVRRVRYSFG